MARLVFSLGLLGTVLACAPRALADEVTDVAAEAGVDKSGLLGAMASTGLGARQYLLAVGELAPLYPPSLPSLWTALADCESSGRWHINSGNGFFGGIQFDRGTWLRHGGGTYASRADLATPEQQIEIGIRTQKVQGWLAWPSCSRRLGLR